MTDKAQRRDLLSEYLSLANQAESLIQQKQALSHLPQDLREMHRLLMQLGSDILSGEQGPGQEADYLAALHNVQVLVEQQALADNLVSQFEAIQRQMETIGGQLGWQPVAAAAPAAAPAEPQPEFSSRLSQLQTEIQGLRTMLT